MHLATLPAKVHHINDESNDNDVRNLHSYIDKYRRRPPCVEWSTVPLGSMANIAAHNNSIDLTIVSPPLLKVLPMEISIARRLYGNCGDDFVYCYSRYSTLSLTCYKL